MFEKGKGFAPTEEGTPQGGVISPLLLNVALHGLEEAAGVRYRTTGPQAGMTCRAPRCWSDTPTISSVCCHIPAAGRTGQGAAGRVAGAPGSGLQRGQDPDRAPRRRVRLPGVQHPPLPTRKLLIKPSKAAIRRLRKRLATEMRALRGSNAAAVLARLNPIIRGWAAYYRAAVSSRIFSALDTYVWKLTYKWARHSHPNKSKTWVVARYFGKFNKFRNDRWVFGDRGRQRRGDSPPDQVPLDNHRPAPDWSTARRPPTTPP